MKIKPCFYHWGLRQLLKWGGNTQESKEGIWWTPCRPENWKYRSFFKRIHQAWDVFTGRADSFLWDDDSKKTKGGPT